MSSREEDAPAPGFAAMAVSSRRTGATTRALRAELGASAGAPSTR